jgi:3-hydroxyisobutyrate dehydrogenase
MARQAKSRKAAPKARKALTRKPARKAATRKPARKPTARRAATRKPAARKAAARRPAAARRAASAKRVTKGAASGRAAAQRPAARRAAPKAAARKALAKKASARKAAARKAPARKAAPKAAARKAAAKKTPARKAAPRPAPAPKAPARAATRRAPASAAGSERIGFIGLGTMGLPQALNIAKAGRPVLVYDARPEAMAEAARQPGVEAAESPRALAERCTLILTCLPDDAAVHAVFRGEEGLLRGLRRGSLTCDLSTVSPEFTEGLDAELRAAGVTHCTGPMLGSKPQAEAGQVFYMLGGPAAALERITPILRLCGRHYIYVGGAAVANKVKLLHNALGAVNYAATAEALALCVQSGVDLQAFYDVMRAGGGMAFGNYFERKAPTIARGDYSPRFKLKLAHKDSQLAKALFARTGVPAPIHDLARGLLEEAMAQGFGEDDASAVTKVVERRIGRPIRQG